MSDFNQLSIRWWVIVVAATLSLLIAACNGAGDMTNQADVATVAATVPSLPAATSSAPASAQEAYPVPLPIPMELGLEALRNAVYQGILEQPVTLVGGRYEGEPFVEGGAARPVVDLLSEPIAYGDLDGDGQTDAAVVLVSDSGGSGTFVYLAVVQSRDSVVKNVATSLLGDRVQVRSLAIKDGRLVVDLLSHAAEDPACCPSLESTHDFRLSGEELISTGD